MCVCVCNITKLILTSVFRIVCGEREWIWFLISWKLTKWLRAKTRDPMRSSSRSNNLLMFRLIRITYQLPITDSSSTLLNFVWFPKKYKFRLVFVVAGCHSTIAIGRLAGNLYGLDIFFVIILWPDRETRWNFFPMKRIWVQYSNERENVECPETTDRKTQRISEIKDAINWILLFCCGRFFFCYCMCMAESQRIIVITHWLTTVLIRRAMAIQPQTSCNIYSYMKYLHILFVYTHILYMHPKPEQWNVVEDFFFFIRL